MSDCTGIYMRRWKNGHLCSLSQGPPPYCEARNFTIRDSFLWPFKEGPEEHADTLGRREVSWGVAEFIGGIFFPLTFHAESLIFLPAQSEFVSTLTGGSWHFRGINPSMRGETKGQRTQLCSVHHKQFVGREHWTRSQKTWSSLTELPWVARVTPHDLLCLSFHIPV